MTDRLTPYMYFLFAIVLIIVLILKLLFRSVWLMEEIFLSIHALILLYEAYQKRKEWSRTIQNVPKELTKDAGIPVSDWMDSVEFFETLTNPIVVIVKSSNCPACKRYMQSDARTTLQQALTAAFKNTRVGGVATTVADVNDDSAIIERYAIAVRHVPSLVLVTNNSVRSVYGGDVYDISSIIKWVRTNTA